MSVAPKFCHSCGYQLEPGGAYCAACGQAIASAAPPPPTVPAPPPPPAVPVTASAVPAPATAPPLIPAPPPFVAQPYPLPAPQPARRQGGAGLFFLGLVIGVLLTAAVVAALSYFLPVHNIANIIGPESRGAQATALPRHPVNAKPPEPGVVPDEEGASGAAHTGEAGTVTIQYDRYDAQQVLACLVYAIFEQQPWLLRDLIGPDGCAFAPYATESEMPGGNNGEEIADETGRALINSDATCLGYSVIKYGQPDKAIIYWLGLNYDWGRLHLGDYAAPTTAFEFFLLDDGWRLCFIGPVPDELVPAGDELKPPPLDFMPAGE